MPDGAHRTTVVFRQGDEIKEFAARKQIDFSAAVNFLISEALENHGPIPYLPQDPIPGINPTEEK